MSDPLLQKAIRLAHAGRREQARDLFIRIVNLDEENELAWLWLADLVADPADQIIALENALTVNPDNAEARLRLQQLQVARAQENSASPVAPAPDLDDALTTPGRDLAAVARRYEATGELEKAIVVYEQMMATAEKRTTRKWARQRKAAIARQLELRQPVPVHTTFTLLRLSLGPLFLYLLLVLIQAAYRPWRVSPIFYLGGVAVFAGSLLLVGSRTTPHHPGWRSVMGKEGLPAGGMRLLLGSLGLLLMGSPYLLLLSSAVRRLLTTPGAPLPGAG